MTSSMDTLERIALVSAHIPGPHEQMVRYHGRYVIGIESIDAMPVIIASTDREVRFTGSTGLVPNQ